MAAILSRPQCVKVEETTASADIDVELVCPGETPSLPPGTHKQHPKRYNLILEMSKCMITREEAQVKFSEYCGAQGPHDGSKINEWGQ